MLKGRSWKKYKAIHIKKKLSPTIYKSVFFLEKIPSQSIWPKLNLEFFKEETSAKKLYEISYTSFLMARKSNFLEKFSNYHRLTLSVFKKTNVKAELQYLNLNTGINNKHTPRRSQTYFYIDTALVVASVGLEPQFKKTSMPQILFAQTLRRALISVYTIPHKLKLLGILSNFGPLWKRINNPNNEYYLDALTNTWIFDLQVNGLKESNIGEETEIQFKNFLVTASNLSKPAEPNLKTNLTDLVNFLSTKLSNDSFKTKRVLRYSFMWSEVETEFRNAHGFLKKKRARSIKKRIAKRIVVQTKRRFWVL